MARYFLSRGNKGGGKAWRIAKRSFSMALFNKIVKNSNLKIPHMKFQLRIMSVAVLFSF